jgi:hypothetical protein
MCWVRLDPVLLLLLLPLGLTWTIVGPVGMGMCGGGPMTIGAPTPESGPGRGGMYVTCSAELDDEGLGGMKGSGGVEGFLVFYPNQESLAVEIQIQRE